MSLIIEQFKIKLFLLKINSKINFNNTQPKIIFNIFQSKLLLLLILNNN